MSGGAAEPVRIRFEGALNDFLPARRRGHCIMHPLSRRTSVKDFIESFGVPHTEVMAILVDGRSVDFAYIVAPGDRIVVHASVAALDPAVLAPLREAPDAPLRFVADSNVGQLARYLRLLGLDVAYRSDIHDDEVAEIASREGRVVLTRDRALLQRKVVTHGFFVRAEHPREQVKEVLARLDLHDAVRPFSRCARCNGELEAVDKAAVLDRLEPKTRRYYSDFRRCRECGQVYWKGGHFERMERLCEELSAVPEE